MAIPPLIEISGPLANTIMEEVSNWARQSKDDLEKARILFDNNKYDGAVFYCQQAVEKMIKALYIKRFKSLRRIHDLVFLAKTLSFPEDMIKKVISYLKYTLKQDTRHLKQSLLINFQKQRLRIFLRWHQRCFHG